jgi:hypothetical protein
VCVGVCVCVYTERMCVKERGLIPGKYALEWCNHVLGCYRVVSQYCSSYGISHSLRIWPEFPLVNSLRVRERESVCVCMPRECV